MWWRNLCGRKTCAINSDQDPGAAWSKQNKLLAAGGTINYCRKGLGIL